MSNPTRSRYSEVRLAGQLEYFERAATRNKRAYVLSSVISMAASSAIPLGVAMDAPTSIAAVLGVVTTFALGLQGVFKYHENWLRFRTASEGLRREEALAAAAVGPYQDLSPKQGEALLARRCESILLGTHEGWLSDHQNEQPVED